MGAKRYKPEEIIAKLREAEVLLAEGPALRQEISEDISIRET